MGRRLPCQTRVLALLATWGVEWLSGATRAHAAELLWQAPEQCPTQQDAQQDVERIVGAPLARFSPGVLAVAVNVTPQGLEARLSRSEQNAEFQRTLRADSCDRLLELTALAVALTLGPPVEPKNALVEPAPPREPIPTPTVAVDKSPNRRQGPTSLAAGVLVDSGSLAQAALGLGVGVGQGWRDLQLRIGGSFLLPRETQPFAGDARGASPSASLYLLAGAVDTCTRVGGGVGVFPMTLCAGLEAGQLRGRGTEVAVSRSGESLWLALRVGLEASWALSPESWALKFGGVVEAPLIRDTFFVEGYGAVHQPSNLVGRLGVAIFFDVR